MEAEFLGETTSIDSVDPYMDAAYPAEGNRTSREL